LNHNIILHFNAYFMETTDGNREPQVRNVNIYFYVEDGSIKVVEKPQLNSGVSQGTLVLRSVIMKEGGQSPFTEEDLLIGECITIYGRHYK
jgi:EF-hand domain-containing protein 1